MARTMTTTMVKEYAFLMMQKPDDRDECRLGELDDMLPSGSGFDCGSKLIEEDSTPQKLVFQTSFHHMTEHGWTEHKVIVTPTFTGIDIRVTGRDRNDIKDYIGKQFAYLLERPLDRVRRANGEVEYIDMDIEGWKASRYGTAGNPNDLVALGC